MAAADFFLRTTQVPANAWMGLNASTGVPALYTAGAVKYWVYEPSTAALASVGITLGQPMPVLVAWSTLSSNLTAVGANEGANMTDGGKLISSKLGFGASNDGSAKLTPGGGNQTWPWLTIFPQMPNAWTPAISGASTRASWMVHDAIMRDVFATYNIDKTRIWGTGVSGNGGVLGEYAIGKYLAPSQFLVRYAGIIPIAGSISGSGWRQDFPNAIQGENSINQTFPRLARYISRDMNQNWYEIHSVLDEQSTPTGVYNFLFDPCKQWAIPGIDPIPVGGGASAGSLRKHTKYFNFHEYTGGSAPTHGNVWDLAYGNNTVAGALNHTDPLWARMASWRYIPTPEYSAGKLMNVMSFDGPLPAAPGTPVTTIEREYRRRRTVSGGRRNG